MVSELTYTISFILLYAFIFLLAKWMKDFLTTYKLNDELVRKDNLAISLTMCGYYFGTLAIFLGALYGDSDGLVNDLIQVGSYSILGIVFLNISRYINDKIILREFCNTEQLVKTRNNAVGIVQLGTYLSTGIIAAGAVSGTGGGVLTACVFFILGQISLFLFSAVYNLLTPYSIHKELENHNVALGAALSGILIALGIIIYNGVSRNFTGWSDNLRHLLYVNITAFVFLPIIRYIMDYLVIPGDKLSSEIIDDKNLGAGILEGTIAISFAVILNILL